MTKILLIEFFLQTLDFTSTSLLLFYTIKCPTYCISIVNLPLISLNMQIIEIISLFHIIFLNLHLPVMFVNFHGFHMVFLFFLLPFHHP
jgi:hypothetical protein